jgi:hypothetical protein
MPLPLIAGFAEELTFHNLRLEQLAVSGQLFVFADG